MVHGAKPCHFTDRSHVNMCVFDSTWEASEAYELDHNPLVDAWVKNDHLGFEVLYVYRGVVRKYRPDYIIRLKTGNMLVLETKGQPDQQTQAKRRTLQQWTQAVNQHGGFGHWVDAVSTDPGDVKDILGKHADGATQCDRSVGSSLLGGRIAQSPSHLRLTPNVGATSK